MSFMEPGGSSRLGNEPTDRYTQEQQGENTEEQKKMEQERERAEKFFLSDFVREASGREQEEGETDEVADRAVEIIQRILELDPQQRTAELKRVRAELSQHAKHGDEYDDQDYSDLSSEYQGMYSKDDFKDLLKLLPESPLILEKAHELLQLTVQEAREILEGDEDDDY